MKNKILTLAVVVIALTQVWVLVKLYQNDNRIAYIDTGKLLQSSKEMQTLKKQMEGEIAKSKANVDTLTVEFQNALKDYEKNAPKMTAKEKELSQELLRNKQNSLIQYQQAMEQKMSGEEQKKTQEVLTAINAYIAEYGASHNYKMIFATASGNIAFGDKGVDITDEIIAGINCK